MAKLSKNTKTELPPNIILRPITLADVAIYVHHKEKTWLETYPNQGLGITEEDVLKRINKIPQEKRIEKAKMWIAEGKFDCFLAFKGNELVGDIIFSQNDTESEINEIYLANKVKGTGLGKYLMEFALAQLSEDKDVILHVLEYNLRAISFYKNYGFKVVGQSSKINFGTQEFSEITMKLSRI